MADAAATGLMGLLSGVAERATAAGVFGPVRVEGERLICEASGSAEPAEYRIDEQDGGVWVSLVMEDRWQSGSIEGDLMHSGDKLDELLEEELAELGYDGPGVTFEHFRSEELLYTFRSPLNLDAGDLAGEASIARAAAVLLGYEATFRPLGDMDAENAEED